MVFEGSRFPGTGQRNSTTRRLGEQTPELIHGERPKRLRYCVPALGDDHQNLSRRLVIRLNRRWVSAGFAWPASHVSLFNGVDDRRAARHDEVRVLEQLELLDGVASDSDEIGGSTLDQPPERRQPHILPRSCRRGRQHLQRRERPMGGVEHELQLLGVDSPGDIGMAQIGAVQQPYPCLDQLAGVVGDTRAVRLRVQRAYHPYARSRRARDQVGRDRITWDVGPLVDAGVQRKPGSLGPAEMDRHDAAVRVGLLDDRPDHLERGDRPRRRGAELVPGPWCARRAARLQGDLDQRGTAGDELADGRAGCLDIGHLHSGAGAEHRDRIATGCGEDRPRAEHSQPPVATGGWHERTAGVPDRRDAVPQDRFRRDLPKQRMAMQVDEAGEHRAGKADELAWAEEAVGRCHGRDPITPDRDRVVLEHSRAVEHPIRGDDVPVAESPPCGLARGPIVQLGCGHDGSSFRWGLVSARTVRAEAAGGVTRKCSYEVESSAVGPGTKVPTNRLPGWTASCAWSGEKDADGVRRSCRGGDHTRDRPAASSLRTGMSSEGSRRSTRTAPAARIAAPASIARPNPSMNAVFAARRRVSPSGPPIPPATRSPAPTHRFAEAATLGLKVESAPAIRDPYSPLASAPRIPTPRAAPTWRPESLSADPRPALAPGTAAMTASVEGTNAAPTPSPMRSSAAPISQ